MNHSHDDDKVTIGCPACIELVRTSEQCARWDEAPLRQVTWHCTYQTSESNVVIGPLVKVPQTETERQPDLWGAP